MDQFFGVPVAWVTAGLALAVGLVLAVFAWIGWRATVLYKLGTRNIPRRPLRAALIVFGLTLSTTVVGGAFGTGDTITYTVQSLLLAPLARYQQVVRSEGLVNQVLVANQGGLTSVARSEDAARELRVLL